MNFVTLEKSDPQFSQLLMGRMPDGEIAVPVKSLHVNSLEEKVTFQILRKDSIRRPSIWIVILQVMRIDLIAFTLIPPIVIFAEAVARGKMPPQMGLALFALFFLHGAVFSRNDFVDHVSGVDRVSEKGGSRVIQNGWISARHVQMLSRVLLFLSVFFAGPIFIKTPQILWLAGIGGGLGLLGYTFLRGKLGWFAGDLAVFLALGPLLTVGANILAGKVLGLHTVILLGCGFGLGVVIYLEIRHLISIVVDDTAGLRTLAVWLGFDRAKIVVAILFVVMGFFLLSAFFSVWSTWGVITAALYILVMLAMAVRTQGVNSPLSSLLPTLLQESTLMHLFYGVIFLAFGFF